MLFYLILVKVVCVYRSTCIFLDKEHTICEQHYRRIHLKSDLKFLAFHGNQLDYNGSQGANGAG